VAKICQNVKKKKKKRLMKGLLEKNGLRKKSSPYFGLNEA
jgi:hypothetical protein